MYNALSNDFSKAERISKRILKHNYVDLDAHRIMVMVFENRNDKTSAKYHSNILNGLIDSILNSGDGLSSESAFVVIAPYEEHIILGVLGLELLSQALIEEDEHYYDVITVKNPNNNKQSTIYLISISL